MNEISEHFIDEPIDGDKDKAVLDAPEVQKKRKPKAPRISKFKSLYPDDALVTVLVEANPKKVGSKSFDRFEHYFATNTVKEFLGMGGSYQDIANDVGRKYVAVTDGITVN